MLKSVLKSFTLSRVLVFLFASLGYLLLSPVHEGISVPLDEPAPWLLSIWYQWDANWYMSIITHGYPWIVDEQSNVAFFPLYPLTVRVIGMLFGERFLLAGLILSSAFLFGGMVYLYRLVKIDYGDEIARRSIWLMAIFPTSIFFTTLYTESLFMMTSVASFYYARRGRWAMAGLWGLLASMTRVTGLMLVIPLAWEYFAQNSYSLRKAIRPPALWLALIPGGVLLYMSYLYLSMGEPLAFAETQVTGWGHGFTLFVGSITGDIDILVEKSEWWVIYELAAAGLLAVLTIFGLKKLRASYTIYMLTSLLFFLAEGTTKSMSRYLLVVFPVFILIPMLARKKAAWISVCAISLVLLAVSTAAFVTGRWVA
ncbi:MAG: mannosyltransferase family protein [Thermoleophilia bacterium]